MLHKTSAKLQKISELYKRKAQKPAKQRKSLRPCAVLTVPQARGLRSHHVAVVQADGGDLVFVVAHEVHDGVAFRALIHIGLDAPQRIERRCVALVYMPEALGDIVDGLLREFAFTQYKGVHAVIHYGIMGHDGIRRHIAVDAATALDQHPLPYLAAFVHQGRAAEYAEVVDLHFTGYLDRIAQNHMVTDLGVVAYMSLRHDEGVVADDGGAVLIDGPIDDDVFADGVVVTYHHTRRVTLPAEVLWSGCDDATFVEVAVSADTGPV